MTYVLTVDNKEFKNAIDANIFLKHNIIIGSSGNI
jgi:hypothetical protein